MNRIIKWITAFSIVCLAVIPVAAEQNDDLEVTIDLSSATTPLPKVFNPNIDLSGRGASRDAAWPQMLAAKEALDNWQKDIGFRGFYRIQYNLWDINQLAKEKYVQEKLLANYEDIIKKISQAGGVVILDIFGTPAGLGKVLDKKSPPWDLEAFKEVVKNVIRDLSCNKKYNIWYEVWSAPDLDDFFLGRIQEYFNLYRVVAESINELEAETKIHIPIGGPSVSWWFQNLDGNTIITPEKNLIYELIKYCYHYRLPLDFISWHAYSTDPQVEKENTIYKKSVVTLIRDWLSYFNFDRNTPLIVDEWNYDRNANIAPERKENAFICASYIPSRIKNMSEASIDHQLYFSLEDFQDNKEGVVRNVGVFSFEPGFLEYKGAPKSTYNVFRMLGGLEKNMFSLKLEDECVGVIATKSEERLAILIYNYIDPDIGKNYLSRQIASLNAAERKIFLNLIKINKLDEIISSKVDIQTVRLTGKMRTLLKKARELNTKATKFQTNSRNIKITIKNLGLLYSLGQSKPESTTSTENYLYQRYALDSSCSLNCAFLPQEQKEVSSAEAYQETLNLNPYSVNMIVLTKKPKEPENAVQPDIKGLVQGVVNQDNNITVSGINETSVNENKTTNLP